ncbi:MAG: peptide ABC transporter substrate-binding protein, partial [Hyphomicrobiales bacterium]
IAIIAAGAALGLRLSGSEGVVLAPESTYTEGVAGTWQRINPIFSTTNEVDQDLASLVFAGLVKLGPDGSLMPDLADLPQVSDDGRTYTFRLKSGLKWQDGVPLTSRDVAFTIAKVQENGFRGDPVLADAWSDVQVEIPDDRTVVFHLTDPAAPFVARNATLGIIPEHILGNLSADQLYDAPFNAKPIGAGPFRLDSIDQHSATLIAFDGYHDGAPSIHRFEFRFYSDYPSALRAASAGDLDGLLFRDTPTEAESTEIDRVRGMEATAVQRAAYVILYLNNDHASFQDPRVRRALSLAIDRQAIAEKVYFGAATPSASAIPPGSWAYAPEYDHIDVNLDEAKRLLEEAGWKPHPTTGILIREGEEFRFTIRTDNDPARVAVANEIAHQLEPIGIRATVISTSFSVLRRDFLQERKYDAAIAGWDQGADPDPYFGWHSSQSGTAGLNIGNFADIVVDELIAKARTTNDIEVRKDQYRQFQEKWDELAPGVVVAYPRYIYLHKDGVEGLDGALLSTASQRFWNVAKWHS